MIDFKLPELGENIDKAEVIRVLVKEGDAVKAEQSVLEIESEKAAMALPAPRAGRIAKVHVKEGDAVKVGQALLSIDDGANGTSQEKPAAAAPAAPARQKPAEAQAAPVAPSAPQKPAAAPAVEAPRADAPTVAAGPATRKLARELGVALERVNGSGPGGRITVEDVQAAVRNRGDGVPLETPPLPDFGQWGPVERQGLNAIARTSAQRLSTAWQLVPHVTQHALADITELEAARRRLEDGKKGEVKITITAFAVKAAAAALKEFPHFNSSYDARRQELIVKRYYHMGVAVDTPHGLLVPVIRDADQKSIRAIAAELAELADRARQRGLSVDQMQGGTFTISNLGGIGGTAFTPIVNYPEAAILGISRGQQQLVQRGDRIESRLMLPLSLSYDHRIVNGADGARFVTRLADLLADPVALLVEI